ncbi:MAG: D-alanine--D-alanine ligase [Candidatus Schekmanbacteria bacterium]|nr:MAG: D-alanine--D-alanine ligase [Candidatus Schekmanbacteria bacterium]
MKDKKVGVLMGGNSPEREISLKTGKAVLDSLLRQKIEAVAIDPAETFIEKIKEEKIDVAFLALHGEGGEDGVIQGFFETVGIPYTGSGVLSSAIAMDKDISKIIFQASGIPTPEYLAIRTEMKNSVEEIVKKKFTCPLVVKPASGGSTIGITIVRDMRMLRETIEEAFKYDEKIIVEEFIEGRDLTVGVLFGKALPVIEIKPKSGFYDYEAKYKKGMTEYLCPAPLSKEEEEKCAKYAQMAVEALSCKGAPRVDLRIDKDGQLFVLEVNTIPGMTETSLLPMAAAKVGIDFDSLVLKILEEACEKSKKK